MDKFLETILQGEFALMLVAFVVAVQVFLLGLGEALTRISKFTTNTWDNDLANKISKLAWYIGVLVSKFGYSTPKLVIEESAREIKKDAKK